MKCKNTEYFKTGNMKKIFALLVALVTGLTIFPQTPLQKFEFVSFSQVNITDNFWKPKIDNVATKTLDACIYQTETKTARLLSEPGRVFSAYRYFKSRRTRYSVAPLA